MVAIKKQGIGGILCLTKQEIVNNTDPTYHKIINK